MNIEKDSSIVSEVFSMAFSEVLKFANVLRDDFSAGLSHWAALQSRLFNMRSLIRSNASKEV
jgi:hypothetical protein